MRYHRENTSRHHSAVVRENFNDGNTRQDHADEWDSERDRSME